MRLLKRNFKTYLQSRHPRTKVGIVRTYKNCPVAKYIRIRTPYFEVVSVNAEVIRAYNKDTNALRLEMRTPLWVAKFIDKVDAGSYGSSINANKCLEILARI